MDVLRCHHRYFILTLIAFSLLFLLTTSSAASLNRFSGKLGERRNEETDKSVLPGRIIDQKRLGSSGGRPPSCTSKCMKCEPCEAVYVSIQPADLEYYAEAWRCKCGDKLFMP